MILSALLSVMNLRSEWSGKEFKYYVVLQPADGSAGSITLVVTLDEYKQLTTLCLASARCNFQLTQVKS